MKGRWVGGKEWLLLYNMLQGVVLNMSGWFLTYELYTSDVL